MVLGLYAALGPGAFIQQFPAVIWPSTIACGVFGLAFALLPAERLDRAGVFVIFAVLGTAELCLCIVLTGRTSIGTQFFLALAVLYAGFHLRTVAVLLVTATALVGDAVVLLLLEPLDKALTDTLLSGLTLVVMAALLVRSGQTRDRLVAELEQQAAVDALTGLVTRRAFDEALEAALARPAGRRRRHRPRVDRRRRLQVHQRRVRPPRRGTTRSSIWPASSQPAFGPATPSSAGWAVTNSPSFWSPARPRWRPAGGGPARRGERDTPGPDPRVLSGAVGEHRRSARTRGRRRPARAVRGRRRRALRSQTVASRPRGTDSSDPHDVAGDPCVIALRHVSP